MADKPKEVDSDLLDNGNRELLVFVRFRLEEAPYTINVFNEDWVQ